jgi:hypothetical protein
MGFPRVRHARLFPYIEHGRLFFAVLVPEKGRRGPKGPENARVAASRHTSSILLHCCGERRGFRQVRAEFVALAGQVAKGKKERRGKRRKSLPTRSIIAMSQPPEKYLGTYEKTKALARILQGPRILSLSLSIYIYISWRACDRLHANCYNANSAMAKACERLSLAGLRSPVSFSSCSSCSSSSSSSRIPTALGVGGRWSAVGEQCHALGGKGRDDIYRQRTRRRTFPGSRRSDARGRIYVCRLRLPRINCRFEMCCGVR